MGGFRLGPRHALQDLRDRRIVLDDQEPHHRRRLRADRERQAAGGRVFARGEGQAGLISAPFGARSLPFMGKLVEDDAGEYVSGLLIGAEITEGQRPFPGEEPHVAGAEGLVGRYLAAFGALGEPAPERRRPAARGL
jgi:2-keto-3-deoxy-galactonokinase